MNTLINSHQIKIEYLSFIDQKEVEIFCPFISTDILKKIVNQTSNTSRIVTRWKISDFQEGFADLELYHLCEDNNIDLYINPRVHLKATLRNRDLVFLSSGNITGKGLNFVSDESFNYELSNIVKISKISDLVYFEQIVQDSIYVNDDVFEEIKKRVEEIELNYVSEPIEFSFMKDKAFYISQLPLISSPTRLYEFYSDSLSDYSKEEYKCAIHDLSIYQIPEDLDYDNFILELSESFFSHPFIDGLIQEVEKDGYIYFGRVKEWIQNKCLDVPVPKRRKLTGITQVLYKWIEELGEGKFEIDRPNYSQRIKIIDQ